MVDSTPAAVSLAPPVPSALLPEPGRSSAALPTPLTSFIGRAREVAVVAELLRRDDARLVTLVGPGGVGKTRLALRVAEETAPGFANGARFVDLSALVDPGLVLPTIAQALGLGETDDRPVAARLGDWLAARELLLVLDNLEQVAAAAPELATLLRGCPALTILATSRVVLRVSGEHVVPVEPLMLPEPARLISASELAAVEAVALFAHRARAADPAFALTEATAPTVAAIVRQLEGLPLAIELAAPRVRQLSLPALLAPLSGRLRLLTGGPRDAPARQRTLRDTIAWSYELLPLAEQSLLRRLAVFVGGCTPTAAEAVCGVERRDVLDGLFALLDQSLLRRVAPPGLAADDRAEPRFGMLETVREFALERLAASGEAEDVQARHAAYMAEYAAVACTLLGPISAAGVARLAFEHDNARAALAWAIGCGDAETGLRLATAYYRLWQIRGYLSEGRRWLEQLLALDGPSPLELRAAAWFELGWLAILQGDLDAAESACQAALALAGSGAPSPALTLAVTGLGVIAIDRGDLVGAEARHREALELAREQGDERNVAGCLLNLGVVAVDRGDLADAMTLYEQALPISRRADDPWALALLLGNLSEVARRQGDRRRAAGFDRERVAINRELGNREQLADCCLFAAEVAVWLNQPERAARLVGAGTAVLEEIGFRLPAGQKRTVDATVAGAHAALGDEAFEAALNAGRALPLEAALGEADRVFAEEEAAAILPAPTAPSSRADGHGLSIRELEVVRLIADGRSNREIADALFISHGTAATHVRNVLTKLGLDSRTAVAAWAIRSGFD